MPKDTTSKKANSGETREEPIQKNEPPQQSTPPSGNFQDQLEKWADDFVASINYDRLALWKEIFFHPTATLTEQMKTPSLKRAAKDVFIASLPMLVVGLVGLALVFFYLFLLGTFAALLAPGMGLFVLAGMVIGAILLIILYFASPIIGWLLISVIQFVVAKLLGGKADFRTHSYMIGLASATENVGVSLFTIIGLVPCVGWIAQPIRVLVSIYGIYLNYKAVKVAHGFDTTRAAAVVVVPFVIGVAMVVAVVLAFYLGLFSLALLARRP